MERWSLTRMARATVVLLQKYPASQVMPAVAQELVRQRRGREADTLLQAVATELWRVRRHAMVTVTSARPLPTALRARVRAALKKHLQATTLTVDVIVEPGQKGGIVATTPIGTLDASVAGRLTQLKHL